MSSVRGECLKALECVESTVRQRPLPSFRRDAREPGVWWRRLSAPVLARQEATSQGEVRKQANLVTRARREKVDFVATANQTQLVLQACKRLNAERCRPGRSLVE